MAVICVLRMVDGQKYWPLDMNRKQIINILNRLHRSSPLMKQLSRLGYTMETPVDLLRSWKQEFQKSWSRTTIWTVWLLSQVRRFQVLGKTMQRLCMGIFVIVLDWDREWTRLSSGLDSVRLTDRMFDSAFAMPLHSRSSVASMVERLRL